MKLTELALLALAAGVAIEYAQPGAITGRLAQYGIKLPAGVLAKLPSAPGTVKPSDPAVIALAASLGTTPWRVAQAANRSGKPLSQLTLADLAGIPEVPDTVLVGGVASHPNPAGPPATPDNPTGGSGTWGGLTDAQIQASFQASYGPNWREEWQRQHDEEVRQRGF